MGRSDTLHGIIETALNLATETARTAERLVEPVIDTTLPTDVSIPLDRVTRRLLDLRAAGLGRSAEDLIASIVRRAARSSWSETRRTRA